MCMMMSAIMVVVADVGRSDPPRRDNGARAMPPWPTAKGARDGAAQVGRRTDARGSRKWHVIYMHVGEGGGGHGAERALSANRRGLRLPVAPLVIFLGTGLQWPDALHRAASCCASAGDDIVLVCPCTAGHCMQYERATSESTSHAASQCCCPFWKLHDRKGQQMFLIFHSLQPGRRGGGCRRKVTPHLTPPTNSYN